MSSYWLRQGLQWIANHPANWLRLTGKKLLLVWNTAEASDTEDPYTYADFDLDLNNPLQDVVGLIGHLGELLDGKSTNHLDMRKVLARTKAKDYLYYSIQSA